MHAEKQTDEFLGPTPIVTGKHMTDGHPMDGPICCNGRAEQCLPKTAFGRPMIYALRVSFLGAPTSVTSCILKTHLLEPVPGSLFSGLTINPVDAGHRLL